MDKAFTLWTAPCTRPVPVDEGKGLIGDGWGARRDSCFSGQILLGLDRGAVVFRFGTGFHPARRTRP